MTRFLMALALLASPVTAQDFSTMNTHEANVAVLRGLDMLTGRTVEFTMNVGETRGFERLNLTLEECRYPGGQRATNSLAHLKVTDQRQDEGLFDGWIFAQSPALNALEHPRYDVWLISCEVQE
ncbi:DUF2155 domain-containing protein [Paracoccaceae bacterium GXU_MW_L88]